MGEKKSIHYGKSQLKSDGSYVTIYWNDFNLTWNFSGYPLIPVGSYRIYPTEGNRMERVRLDWPRVLIIGLISWSILIGFIYLLIEGYRQVASLP